MNTVRGAEMKKSTFPHAHLPVSVCKQMAEGTVPRVYSDCVFISAFTKFHIALLTSLHKALRKR